MKILVTGASGFIGTRFAQFALQQGFEVRVSGRREAALASLIECGAEFVAGDPGDAQAARSLCVGIEAVVHCAGAANPWGEPEALHQATVQVTENMVEACLKERVRRLVYVSSAAVYGYGRSRQGIKEDQVPARGLDRYARDKALAEQKVFGAAEFGLQVLALRPAMVIGSGATGLLPDLLRPGRHERLLIVGNGLNKVDFTSVHNLNQALYSALLAGSPALGRAYNISNGAPVPIWDVINYALRRLHRTPASRYQDFAPLYLAATLGEMVCGVRPGRPTPRWSRQAVQTLDKDFTLDISRARHHLGYVPNASLWAALDELCASI
jgi:nucleoside-diphosphate-sugar epimerase